MGFAEKTRVNDEYVVTDVCVIGSGPAGAIPAVELSRAGYNVLLLEAGPQIAGDGATLFTNQIDVDGQVDLPFVGTVQLGGSSNLWAGRIAPLESIDFEHRGWVPDSGWPIEFSELPYEQAFRLLTDVAMTQSDQVIPQLRGFGAAVGSDALEFKRFYWARQPFNVARYLSQEAQTMPGRLQVLTDSPVVELLTDDAGREVECALVKGHGDGLLRVNAKVFILAAGGLETPRLLLSSRRHNPSGIGNEYDLVGRYLSTHPKADIATLTLKRRIATNHALFTDKKFGIGRERLGLGFSPSEQKRLGLLNHYVQLSPFLEYRASRLFEALRATDAVQSPFIDGGKLVRSIMPSLGLFAFDAIGRLAGLQKRAKIFILRGFLDQYPNAENRVMLSGVQNKLGIEVVNLIWKYSSQDRDSVLRFLAAMNEKLETEGVGKIDYSQLSEQKDVWPLTAIHSHFMGTTRMGREARLGVVDANCRVFGQTNLFVSGPSVFTTYGYANPFLTIAALGIRLASHIKRRGLQSSSV